MNKALILVRYGPIKKNYKYRLLLRFVRNRGYKLVEIDTKQNEQKDGYCTNEAFEFSGYRAGFENALKLGKNLIIFVNDTFLESHFIVYSFYTLNIFDKMKYMPNRFYGILSQSKIERYFSTWIFMIHLENSHANKISFYDHEIPFNKFFRYKYDFLDLNFKKNVFEWLMPKNKLRGWYKTGPNIFISLAEIKRKIYTIYLEHMLYKRLLAQGFVFVPINFKFFSKILGLIDKTKFLYLKIKFRIFKL